MTRKNETLMNFLVQDKNVAEVFYLQRNPLYRYLFQAIGTIQWDFVNQINLQFNAKQKKLVLSKAIRRTVGLG